tara:strand:- start:14959 stop:15249 length:291 start_codon:yes stop_codon:yes gene_type:complete
MQNLPDLICRIIHYSDDWIKSFIFLLQVSTRLQKMCKKLLKMKLGTLYFLAVIEYGKYKRLNGVEIVVTAQTQTPYSVSNPLTPSPTNPQMTSGAA